MSFAKLDSGIIDSSLWEHPDHVIRVWITLLAKKDENGFVLGTHGSIKRIANLHDDQNGQKFSDAIKILESPDPNSKTPDFEGRRVEKIDGGWVILNHEKYRLHDHIQREKTRDRVKRYREKIKEEQGNASVSESVSEKEGAPGKKTKRFVPPAHLESIWPDYLKTRDRKRAAKTDNALQLIVKELEKLAPNDLDKQLRILEESVKNGWSGVYSLRREIQQSRGNPGRSMAPEGKYDKFGT